MTLERFSKVGSGMVECITDDFCTLDFINTSIIADELQIMLDLDWVQQGEPIEGTYHAVHKLLRYNFRKIQRGSM